MIQRLMNYSNVRRINCKLYQEEIHRKNTEAK